MAMGNKVYCQNQKQNHLNFWEWKNVLNYHNFKVICNIIRFLIFSVLIKFIKSSHYFLQWLNCSTLKWENL